MDCLSVRKCGPVQPTSLEAKSSFSVEIPEATEPTGQAASRDGPGRSDHQGRPGPLRRPDSRSGRLLPSWRASRSRSSRRPGTAPRSGVRWGGRIASIPGRTANVAPCSVTTHQRVSFASRDAGPDRGEVGEHGVEDLGLAHRQQIVARADDDLEILAASLVDRPPLDGRVVEDPLDQPADRDHMLVRADRPVEPEVDPGDRRRLHANRARRSAGIRSQNCRREQSRDAVERDGEHDEIGVDRLARAEPDAREVPSSSSSTGFTPVVRRTSTPCSASQRSSRVP